jgi:hypothetical protein
MSNTTGTFDAEFTIPKNKFKKIGYRFIGWHLKRSDEKWFVPGVGWKTEAIINSNSSYNKQIYGDETTFPKIESSFLANGFEYAEDSGEPTFTF